MISEDNTGHHDRGAATARRTGASGRGQTTLDFALGASLFLLALLGVLIFVSGTIQPFAEGSQEDIGVADRVADGLAEGLLAEPATPHVLNATCTVEFFEDNSPDYCRHEGDDLTDRVGVKDWQYVNVTMQTNLTTEAGEETVCWDQASEGIVARSDGDCDTASGDVLFTVGPTAPESAGDTVTARRVVSINGTDTTMHVEVW